MSEERIYDPDKMSETRELMGGIALAEWQPAKTITSKTTGEQFEVGETLHIEIEPLDIQDCDFVFHEWYPYTKIKNSKYGKFMAALKALGTTLKSEKDLMGKVFVWERQILEFGDMKSKPTWMPIDLPPSMKKERQAKMPEKPKEEPAQSEQPAQSTPARRGRPSFGEYKKEVK